MKLCVFIICLSLAGCEGLHISRPNHAALLKKNEKCKDETHWGIWIDGRDAYHGENFYGRTYSQSVEPALKKMYARAKLNLQPDMILFRDVAELVNETFREDVGYHGLTGPVRRCLKKFDTEHFNEIMGDVIVMDKTFHYKKNATKGEQVSELFEEYNKKQRLAFGQPEEQIRAIGFLMHNLGFAHPLRDHNGRVRLLLLQHELRRLGLGCGAMLYNNNRDMCFNTPTETKEKIKEGMLMYKEWQETGENPWTDPANRQKHLTTFARSNSKALSHCWHEHGQTAPCSKWHKGCNHKGTSLE